MRTRSGVSVTGSGRPQKRVARQRPRSSATTNDANDNDIMLVCDKCNKSIHPQADHITSHPCQHNFCTKCMISAHFKRGSRPFLCPITSCMGESSRTTHCQYYCNRVAEEVLTNPAVDPVYLKKDLPVEYLLHTHQNELSQDGSKEGVVLYCGRAKRTHDGKFGVKYVSVSYVHQPNNTGVYSSDILLEIGKYFSYLHNIILVPSKHHAQTHLPVLSPREYLEYRHSTIRPIDAALFSLSTGKFAPEFDLILEKDHTTFQNQYLATIAASDLLLRSVSNAPCFFQLMFGELLQRQNVSRQFLDICSAFQLAPSRKFYWKDRSKEVISALEKGLTIRPRDVVLLLFDNIGFKVLGKFASYDQWTLLQIIVIKEDDLKKAGFYNDDGQEQISRVPELDWIEEIENSPADELIDKVVGLRDEDYDILSECVLEDIFLALEYAPQLQDGEGSVGLKLPRMERIINYHTRQSIDNQSHHQNSDHIIERDNPSLQYAVLPRENAPIDYDNEIGEDITNNNTTMPIANSSKRSRYQQNNAKLEPLHENLAKTSVVEKLMKYAIVSSKKQCNAWDIQCENGEYLPDDEPPLAEIIAPLSSDGQPIAQAYTLLARDAGNISFPKKTAPFFGGFHTVMKTLNAQGELFEQMLTHFFSSWRDSIERVRWILFPSDPRQREGEYPFYALAHNVAAAVALYSHNTDMISAVDVNNFMLERALEYPICNLVLLELRMGTIAKIMRMSERIGERGSVDIFLSSLRFAMRMFAVTHKTDYMRLSCNLLLWWSCASPALKKVYSNFIFTQLTSKGNPIFSDLCMEMSVFDVRQRLGKVYRSGMELAMEHQCNTIPQQDGEKLEAKTLRDKNLDSMSSSSRSFDTITSDGPFLKVFKQINAMKLWTPGSAPEIGMSRKKEVLFAQKDILEVPGGGKLHASLLSSVTVEGEKRVRDYFKTNYIDENDKVERSEKEVYLGRVASTVQQISREKNQRIKQQTSIDWKELKKQFTIDELIAEINEIRNDANNSVEVTPLPRRGSGGLGHEDYAKLLAKYRKHLFAKDVTIKERLIGSINQNYECSEATSEEERASILSDKLFSLSQNVIDKARYNESMAPSRDYDVDL